MNTTTTQTMESVSISPFSSIPSDWKKAGPAWTTLAHKYSIHGSFYAHTSLPGKLLLAAPMSSHLVAIQSIPGLVYDADVDQAPVSYITLKNGTRIPFGCIVYDVSHVSLSNVSKSNKEKFESLFN